MPFSLLFLAGIPASGKSHFGRWLAEKHGYVHIDAEVDGELERLGVRDLWNEAFASKNCTSFARALLARRQPVIFNWGFPVSCLPMAAAIKSAGFSAWWFDADAIAARAAYTANGRSGPDFDTQYLAIESVRHQINDLFKPNTVSVLNAKGNRLSPAKIFNKIRRLA